MERWQAALAWRGVHFIVTFADKAGLDAYIPHEAHQAFVKELRPILDDVFVFDFVAK